MARSNFTLEKGISIVEENSDAGVDIITGTGAPAGTSGETDDAPIGSLYLRQDGEGELYRKMASTSSASDWEPMVDGSVYTALGIPFDDEDFGTYTGGILTDDTDAKTNIQELSDAIEAISAPTTSTDAIPAATPTTVSTCLVDNCNGVEWEVCVYETASEGTKEFFKLTSIHDGTSGADATTFDESAHTKIKLANIAGLTFTSVLAGTGASQTLGLEISATAAVTVKTRRTEIP